MSQSKDAANLFRDFLDALNRRDWDAMSEKIGPGVLREGETVATSLFLNELKTQAGALSDATSKIHTLVVGEAAAKVAAIVLHSGSSGGRKTEWAEFVFCGFENGTFEEYTNLKDHETVGVLRSVASGASVPDQVSNQASDVDLGAVYLQYIDAINTQTMAKHFPKYCQPLVVHNGRDLSMDEYRGFIESSLAEVEGLYFDVVGLVVDDKAQRVAARIELTGRPVKEFLGMQPTGRDIKFMEHVFYEFREGKIARVWSALDLAAVKACLEPPDEP
ncbi:SnoaL-like polyketide cyclase-domain-containing protein [Dactylonectria estremocensis]|uniref:SnoaL-like polyketide cyclase-domain-containing protein n=1 Tax=Dactylonectria estremocensis TaxID=1079267 RepID=A0A9P9FCM8_9HYPO|nr:SnoaL-like polyketide cyclase-domain-containing protein [Dactylonectria estremocensis]